MTASIGSPIHLRALEPEDLELLYTIENDPGLWDVGASPAPLSRFALRRYLSAEPQNFFESGELRLVIETEEKLAIGLIDLTSHSPLDRRAEIGIALLAECRERGFGTAALAAVEEYARQYLHIRLLYAIVSASANPACTNLFTSSGYMISATLPAWHIRGEKYEDATLFTKIFEKK